MCLVVNVDIMTKCKELFCKNLESLCFTTTVKCHTSDVVDIYLVVAQLKSLLRTQYLCTGLPPAVYPSSG
jgi:hypothetical protein